VEVIGISVRKLGAKRMLKVFSLGAKRGVFAILDIKWYKKPQGYFHRNS